MKGRYVVFLTLITETFSSDNWNAATDAASRFLGLGRYRFSEEGRFGDTEVFATVVAARVVDSGPTLKDEDA